MTENAICIIQQNTKYTTPVEGNISAKNKSVATFIVLFEVVNFSNPKRYYLQVGMF